MSSQSLDAGTEGRSFAVAVLAKEPRPGHVKTRLCPPFSAEQAARLAEAALLDTLDVAAATPTAARRVLVLDGTLASRQRSVIEALGFETVAQRGLGLDDRLGSALCDVAGLTGLPVLLVGMDTPQLRPRQLAAAAAALAAHDAVLGPATDGGFWAVGINRPHPHHFAGVPMSQADTGARQLERLRQHGLRTAVLEPMTDVDDAQSAYAVALNAPHTRFARLLRELTESAA